MFAFSMVLLAVLVGVKLYLEKKRDKELVEEFLKEAKDGRNGLIIPNPDDEKEDELQLQVASDPIKTQAQLDQDDAFFEKFLVQEAIKSQAILSQEDFRGYIAKAEKKAKKKKKSKKKTKKRK